MSIPNSKLIDDYLGVLKSHRVSTAGIVDSLSDFERLL